jgi:hypothetical protein
MDNGRIDGKNQYHNMHIAEGGNASGALTIESK